jgi:mevalonate kinase
MTVEKGKTLVVSVPWPVRLFGDLQYFLGLPAITLALDLRTAVAATPRSDGRFTVSAAWIPEPLSFEPGEAAKTFPQMPALSRALRAVQPGKEKLPERAAYCARQDGCDFHVISRAPWTDALPDSPALLAAWTVALLSLDAQLADLSGNETAEVACRAYRDEPPAARWIPETYACILGGMLFLEPCTDSGALSAAKPAKVAPIDRALPGIVSCYAGPDGKGLDRYAQAVRGTLSALSGIVKLQEGFNLRDASADEVIPRLRELPDADAGVVYAHLAMRDLCRQAFELLESEYGIDDDRLVEMMDKQHEMLRDYLGYNVPEIEALIPVATGGGALGSKIVLGTNSFIAVAPGREKEVISSVKQADGDAVSVAVAPGMRAEMVPMRKFEGLKKS